VARDAETRAELDRLRREHEAMSPEECLRVAAFARESAKGLPTKRQREIGEETAVWFENQAAQNSASASA
jgi:hypothetical protein